MASSKEYASYVMEKFSALSDVISMRPMMGEYVIHFAGRTLGFLADEQIIFQSTATLERLLPNAEKRELFPGSKLFTIIDDGIDKRRLCEIAMAIYDELPICKPRKKKGDPKDAKDAKSGKATGAKAATAKSSTTKSSTAKNATTKKSAPKGKAATKKAPFPIDNDSEYGDEERPANVATFPFEKFMK